MRGGREAKAVAEVLRGPLGVPGASNEDGAKLKEVCASTCLAAGEADPRTDRMVLCRGWSGLRGPRKPAACCGSRVTRMAALSPSLAPPASQLQAAGRLRHVRRRRVDGLEP